LTERSTTRGEVEHQLVEADRPFDHRQMSGVVEDLKLRASDQLGQPDGVGDGDEHVVAALDDQGRLAQLGQLAAQAAAQQRLERRVQARRAAPPDQLAERVGGDQRRVAHERGEREVAGAPARQDRAHPLRCAERRARDRRHQRCRRGGVELAVGDRGGRHEHQPRHQRREQQRRPRRDRAAHRAPHEHD